MKHWKISDAKARLSECIAACVEEPQVLYNRSKPVAVLVPYDEFNRISALDEADRESDLASALVELAEINRRTADLEIPPRANRAEPDWEGVT